MLGGSGQARSVEALGKGLSSAPADVQLEVLRILLPESGSSARLTKRAVTSFSQRYEGTRLDDDALPVAETLLISLLSERTPQSGMKVTFARTSLEEPRICDVAATVLSKRWPEKYRFQWTDDAEACDPQIEEIQNRWRERQAGSKSP